MPLRILTVTGTSPRAPSSTTAPTTARKRSRFHGSAEPPPLRVTFGTGQPKLRSMWSARSSRDEQPGGGPRSGRVGAVELDRARVLLGVVLDEPHRLGVALDEGPRRDHLADVERRVAAPALRRELAAQPAERPVGDPRHRREDDRRPDGVPADPQRGGEGRGAGLMAASSVPSATPRTKLERAAP